MCFINFIMPFYNPIIFANSYPFKFAFYMKLNYYLTLSNEQ